MALKLLTGKTGSGKTYYAVSLILDSLNADRKVFTNIQINIEDDNYVYLDELGIKSYLEFIEKTFKEVHNLEDKKHDIQKSIYFESDFVIDEAHLVGFRDKKESILNWFTLQRHFNQNIHIVTQVPTNIHRDYLAMFHSHIEMIPPNKRLSKSSLGLKEFDCYKGDRLRTSYFKPELQLFELYNSGNIEVGVNQDIFKLGGILVVIVVLFSSIWFTSSSFYNSVSNVGQYDKNSTTVEKVNDIKSVDVNKTVIVNSETIMCDTKDGCYYEGFLYSFNAFMLYVLPRFKEYDTQTVMSSKDWKMVKYTLYSKN